MEVEEEGGHDPFFRIWSTRIPSTSAVYGSGLADQSQDERQLDASIVFPEIRALLGTVSLKSRTPGVADQRQDER